ncbi:MAG TPA: lyase family protein [Acidobacteriota bacterium]|nr:lyase family protein [Acidobacteriota bacterium]
MNFFDAVSPFDARYYGADEVFYNKVHDYLSEAAGIRYFLRVEDALVQTLAEYGFCSPEVSREVSRACAEVTAEEVYREEARIQHNIRALVNCIRGKISEGARGYIHLFATSNDIMDTAVALRYREFNQKVLLPDLINSIELIADLARRECATAQIGRTHGQHAEPITFGYALALYVSRLGGRAQKLESAGDALIGKFAGPVGAHNALTLALGDRALQFERDLLAKLGLKPSATGVSSQLVEQEPLTDLAYTAISVFGVLANLADDMRHLYRTEIGEVREAFQPERVGSSTMPHKVNPKDFENVKSLWKAYAPRLLTVLMDQISEHQRDLTNSASGRYVAELLAAVDYAIYRTSKVFKVVEVRRDRMRENLEMSRDAILAEPLYIILGLHGCPDAYDWSKKLADASRLQAKKIIDLMEAEPGLQPYLSKFTSEEKVLLNDPAKYVGNAVSGALQTCDHWLKICGEIKSRIS